MTHSKIIQNGWLQLSIVPEELQEAVGRDSFANKIKKDDILIILSQSCDVLHHDYNKEPNVEVVVANRINEAGLNKVFFDTRHPRTLQFYINIDGEKLLFQIESYNKFSFPRALLADYEPRKNVKVLLSTIPMWIGKKYFRPAFPDNFNSRLKPQDKAIKKLIERGHEPIDQFFLSINSLNELDDNQVYEIEMLGVVSDKSKINEASNLLSKLEGIMNNCVGISASNFSARMDSDITLAVVKTYMPWIPYDYLSALEADE